MPMAWHAVSYDSSIKHAECGKERGCSVSFVIVSAALRMPKLHGKKRLRSVECLYLALLINGQDQSLLRRTQVKSHHIHYLLNQQRIIAVLKRLLQMRLKSIPIPDSLDGRFTGFNLLGEPPDAPVGFVFRHFQRRCYDLGLFVSYILGLTAPPWSIRESLQSMMNLTVSPQSGSLHTAPALLSHRLHTKASSKRQHDADTPEKPLFSLSRPKKPFQLHSVVITKK
jgi:hypothetical protein